MLNFFFLSLDLPVLENVVFDEHTREVDYSDKSVTGNKWFFFSCLVVDPNSDCVMSWMFSIKLFA